MYEGKRDKITDTCAGDDPEEDPGVVGHDGEHQHVAQGHLQHVERRLGCVQQPTGEEEPQDQVLF